MVRALLLLLMVCVPMLGACAGSVKQAYPAFRIGAAVGGLKGYKENEVALLVSQFNAVTPENCMKAQPIHPEEGRWRFEEADSLVAFAGEHQMDVFGHALVWHHQCPGWFFQDGDKAVTREVAVERLKSHITTLVTRYKGKVRGWDVVNEAISDVPEEFLRRSSWYEIVGEDYIELAFRFAHEADPAAELQYNDYGIEHPAKREKAIALLRMLLEKGVPITSVGIQCHYQLDHVPLENLEQSIREFRALGLKVAITELDIDVMPRKTEGADAGAVEAATLEMQKVRPCSWEVLGRQAEQYAALFAMFQRHKEDLVRVTFWGLDDGHTWLNHWPMARYNHPLLWDREARAKPAYWAVIWAGK